MSLKGDITHDGKITVGFIVLVSLLTGAMTYLTCFVGDDLVYSGVYSDTIFGDKPFPGFGPWLELFVNHWVYFNGRLGDKLMPLFLIMPHIVLAFIQALCTFLIIKYTSLIAIGTNWYESRRTLLLLSALLVFTPWYDAGFMICILVNYQISLVLSLIWTWYYINPPQVKKWGLAALVLLSACVGMWHEGFSVFALPAVVLSQILRKDKTPVTWVMTISFIIGIIILLLAPGFWNRMDNTFEPRDYNWPLFFKKSFIELIFIALTIFTIVRNYLRKRKPVLTREQWIFVAISLSVVFCTIYVNFNVYADMLRVWWFACVYSLTGCFILVGPVRLNSLLKNVVTGIVALAVIVHLSLCVYYQNQVKGDYDKIMEEYINSDNGVVYAETKRKSGPELLTLRKSQYYLYDYLLPHAFNVHPQEKPISLLPPELKDVKLSELDPLKGSPGFYLTAGGEFVYKGIKMQKPDEVWFTFIDKDGSDRCFKVYGTPIAVDNDSNFVYVRLSRELDREEVAVPLGLYY